MYANKKSSVCKLLNIRDLPADNTDFSDLNSFKRSISSTLLATYCKVYFF